LAHGALFDLLILTAPLSSANISAMRGRIPAVLSLLLVAIGTARAQFSYTTNANGLGVSITGCSVSLNFPHALTIPATINGLPVTSIGSAAFYNFYNLTSVTIPSGVTRIQTEAFYDCSGLTSVTIPDTVISIGNLAFEGCSSLTSITIPASVVRIGDSAFQQCARLSSVYCMGEPPTADTSVFFSDYNATVYYFAGNTGWGSTFAGVPAELWDTADQAEFGYMTNADGLTITITNYFGSGGAVSIPLFINAMPVTVIGTDAFVGAALTHVMIPAGVTSIGSGAFSGSGLIRVTIPDNVTSIGVAAFSECSRMIDISISDSVTNIGGQAFQDCSGLTSVTIPGSVISIGYQAFDFDEGLTNVVVGNGVASIGEQAFSFDDSLSTVAISSGVTNIGIGAFYEAGLTSVSIPSGVATVANSAFFGCSGLTNATIASGVAAIGLYAFAQSGLSSVTIPASVTNLGEYAFSGCANLTNVYFTGNAPGGDSTVFSSGNAVTAYYLPGTMGWSDFATNTGVATEEWVLPNPTILTAVPSLGAQTNTFGFTVSWATNLSVVVEACSDLINPAWSPVQTRALANGSFYFSEPMQTNSPGRFYRIVRPAKRDRP
jgi:hypothetical protein